MIEKAIRDYLINKAITGITNNIFMQVPENKPDKYVLIQKTAGYIEDQLGHATIIIQTIAPSKYEAAQMCEAIVKEMRTCTDDEVGTCTVSGFYDFPNTQTKENRYQAVFLIAHYLDL